MKYFIAVLALVVVAMAGYLAYVQVPALTTGIEVKALQKALAEKDATINQLKAAADVYTSPADKLDAAAQAGLTEQVGWQAMKIIEHGGDGSVFYQLEASTRKDGNVSTVGPHGFSWRTTTDDALEAAKLRRGSLESEETKPPK